MSGDLNLADLSRQWSSGDLPPLHLPMGALFFTAFGIKAALFPWFSWLPASYHAPPAAVSAIFAGLLTKVGVYSMFRVFTILFRDVHPAAPSFVLIVSVVTMVIGVTCALTQRDLRRSVGAALEAQAALAERNRARVDEMRAYARSRGCRRELLLAHFGATLEEGCAGCDNCDL